METKDSVQKQFAPVAANYATSVVHVAGPDLTAMLAAADARPDQRALDAGCGTGHTALAFAPQLAEVVALDLTEAMLAQGRKLARDRSITNVTFQRGDVERMPFPDASFDLVTSRYSAHHYPHPLAALREFMRVLKPGGTFLLVDVVSPELPAQDTFLNAIELLRDPSHVRDHTIEQWLRTMPRARCMSPARICRRCWRRRMRARINARSMPAAAPGIPPWPSRHGWPRWWRWI